MADKKERIKQYPITLKESVYRQVSDYCETWHLKRTQFVEIAIHTFLHMDGDPRDICKNISDNPPLPGKVMEELTATLKKTNRLQKKILAHLEMETVERENTEMVVPSPVTGVETPKSVLTEELPKAVTITSDTSSDDTIDVIDDEDYKQALVCFESGAALNAKLQIAMVRHGRCPKCGEPFSDKGKYLGHTIRVDKCPYFARGTIQDPIILNGYLPVVTPIKL